jgi:hypothetical protein
MIHEKEEKKKKAKNEFIQLIGVSFQINDLFH